MPDLPPAAPATPEPTSGERDELDVHALRAVQHELRCRAKSARQAFATSSLHAASLRGKACGYAEAADLIEAVLRGGSVRRKFRSLEARS